MDKLIIFDTTLRDGEQAPGATLNKLEKIEIAKHLVRLGVDIIEAGFPISSEGDFDSVKLIASQIKGATICGLARAIKADIDAAYKATKPSSDPRIHIFLATSKIHMKYKLKKAEDEIIRLTDESVRYAKKYVSDVEFSPEDASRTEKEFLFKVVETAINAGAKTINIPDTVGYADPVSYGALIRDIIINVPNVNKAIISVHCHNDLGLAVANSLSAIRSGARQVECTINGIGERAGNASMEEIVMAVKIRRELYNCDSSINTKEILKASRMVSKLTGFVVAPNKAIVGANAFRHEAGIHQDGVLKRRETYEIIRPKDVGFKGEGLVLGKHSGRHAFAARLKTLGFDCSDKQLQTSFKKFKDLADKKKVIYDEDLLSIMEDQRSLVNEVWQLSSIEIKSGTNIKPVARVRLKSKGSLFDASSSGDGPVDACFKAIDKLTKIKGQLIDYSLQSVTKGKDAIGEVTLKIVVGKEEIAGRGASTDILEASARAYINAINKSLSKNKSFRALLL